MNNRIRIDCNNTTAGSDKLYGLFFEDINHSADGGMNAELIQNNSFEFQYINYNENGEPVRILFDKLRCWSVLSGTARISEENGMNANNPSYLSVLNCATFCNTGYEEQGIPVDVGDYSLSLFARCRGFKGVVRVYLADSHGRVSSVGEINAMSEQFTKHTLVLTVDKKASAKLMVETVGEGWLDLDYFSLLPPSLYGSEERWRHGRLCPEFVECLKQLKPRFLRFPGGCIAEGDVDFSNMYDWKQTVGELHERCQKANTWQYMQSYAVGFYEYLLLCEELGAAPLPVLHCGLLCQIRTGMRNEGDRFYHHKSREFYTTVVQSIAHLIYFCLGNTDSQDEEERRYATLRASMGHAEPFALSMVAIGNENWGNNYFTNLNAAIKALSCYNYLGKPTNLLERYGVKVVSSVGVDVRPQDTNESWQIINKRHKNTIVDEHVYNSPQWFIDNAHRYDSYDRTGAEVFMGEYAVHTESDGRGRLGGVNSYRAALAEAVFLSGCERNSDIVKMTCYAPLFAKLGQFKWSPDLIWFSKEDGNKILRTPSYYVQQLFAENYGERVIAVEGSSADIAGGIFIGSFNTAVLVRSVRVTVGGKTVFAHSFSEGLGEFRVYPNCEGGSTSEEGLLISRSSGLNGFYLDKRFSDCTVEIDATRVEGEEGYILGLGLNGVKPCTPDCDALSLWLNYGTSSDKVAFEKRFNYIRTAYEVIEGCKAEFSDRDRVLLKLCKGRLSGFVNDRELFTKQVYHTAETLFVSATADSSYAYIKAINIHNQPHDVAFDIVGACGVAEVVTLHGELDEVNTLEREGISPFRFIADFNGTLELCLKPNSVNVVKVRLMR